MEAGDSGHDGHEGAYKYSPQKALKIWKELSKPTISMLWIYTKGIQQRKAFLFRKATELQLKSVSFLNRPAPQALWE